MALDLFQRLGAETTLHPQFILTRDAPSMGPARAVLRDVAAAMDDPDGNFVQQFQTHGFDARTFELYLQALFTEAGHAIDRSHDRPDFLISRDGLTVAVEAVTANPPPRPDYQPYELYPQVGPANAEEAMRFLKHEVAIKIGSPLYSKLQKKYWDLPHVAGRPFVIALENFHGGGLNMSANSVSQYLYGIDHRHWFDDGGNLVVEGDAIIRHEGSKIIPSNFFGLPDAVHVSGILFSNTGTVPKFGRIGQQGAHPSGAVRMVRIGDCWDPDPNATMSELFAYEVGNPEMPPEPWRDGSVFMRNPNALHPLPDEWIGAGAEENLSKAGTVVPTFADPFHVYSSQTLLFRGDVPDGAMWDAVEQRLEILRMAQGLGENWRSEAT